jgi:hypothetical protein
MKTCFIGHRDIIQKDLYSKLLTAIQNQVAKNCKIFTMGTHGNFDRLALSICKKLKTTNKNICIEVVITTPNFLTKDKDINEQVYKDVETVMYEIEDIHFKQRIILSNKKMIDTCDTLICYIDPSIKKSGAKTALRYAEKHGLKIINLFENKNP